MISSIALIWTKNTHPSSKCNLRKVVSKWSKRRSKAQCLHHLQTRPAAITMTLPQGSGPTRKLSALSQICPSPIKLENPITGILLASRTEVIFSRSLSHVLLLMAIMTCRLIRAKKKWYLRLSSTIETISTRSLKLLRIFLAAPSQAVSAGIPQWLSVTILPKKCVQNTMSQSPRW